MCYCIVYTHIHTYTHTHIHTYTHTHIHTYNGRWLGCQPRLRRLRGYAGQATRLRRLLLPTAPSAVGSNRLRRLRSRLRRLRCRLRRQNLQTALSQPKMPKTGNRSEDAHRKISKKKVFWFLGFIDAINGPISIFFLGPLLAVTISLLAVTISIWSCKTPPGYTKKAYKHFLLTIPLPNSASYTLKTVLSCRTHRLQSFLNETSRY